jgi:hypothetical protein
MSVFHLCICNYSRVATSFVYLELIPLCRSIQFAKANWGCCITLKKCYIWPKCPTRVLKIHYCFLLCIRNCSRGAMSIVCLEFLSLCVDILIFLNLLRNAANFEVVLYMVTMSDRS